MKGKDYENSIDFEYDVIVGENVTIHKVKTDNDGDVVTGFFQRKNMTEGLSFD